MVRMPAVSPNCPLCSTPGTISYRSVPDRLHHVPGCWDSRRCPSCGTLWIDPRPLPMEIPALYPHSYYTHDATASSRRGGWRKLAATVWPLPGRRRRLDQGLPGLAPASGRLLEVGCGSGRNLGELAESGWSVVGQDVDPLAIDAARACGFDARCGELVDLADDLGMFDVVLLNHVIEHLLDPVSVLRTANRLLLPGGRLVIATPNANSFLRRSLRSWWNPLDVPRHVIVFSERSLRSAIDSAGFTSITTHTSSIVVERICGDSFAAILAPTHLPARAKWVIARLAGVVAQAVAAILRADARGVGDELRAVALAGSRQQ